MAIAEANRMIPGLDIEDTTRAPLAHLNSAGLPIDAGQTHKVWRGQVQVPGRTQPSVPVALKWMAGQVKLAIELACALAAGEMNLPVPRGVVVLADRDQLPGLASSAKRITSASAACTSGRTTAQPGCSRIPRPRTHVAQAVRLAARLGEPCRAVSPALREHLTASPAQPSRPRRRQLRSRHRFQLPPCRGSHRTSARRSTPGP